MSSVVPFARWWRRIRLLVSFLRHSPGVLRQHRFPRGAEKLLEPFRAPGPLSDAAYANLVRYFATGWRVYRDPEGAGAAYPGYPGWNGRRIDRLEGFARIMPLFGAWCSAGRSPVLTLPDGSTLSLPNEFTRGLLAGTDPSSSSYWGDIKGPRDQRTVEAADVALALWLFRRQVWDSLTEDSRRMVVNWLASVEGKPGIDNNWQLFYVLIDRILTSLGYPDSIPSARNRYQRILEFDLGDGWFTDGPDGRVDFYSAWGFHYALHWIDHIDPSWDPETMRTCQRRFLTTYRYLLGPRGVPIMGRSVPYRLAVAAPLVAATGRHPDVVSAGEARRALECTWRYFVGNGAVRHGAVSQGYLRPDLRLVDFYSGPASGLWSLRSLVTALALPDDDPFWAAQASPLPVEQYDYDIVLPGPRWRVRGEQATGAVSIEVLDNDEGAAPPLEPVPLSLRLRSIAIGKSIRPNNHAAKYGRRLYRSDDPLG